MLQHFHFIHTEFHASLFPPSPPLLPLAEHPDWWYSSPVWFRDYFTARGIAPKMIEAAAVIPLTPTPNEDECRQFKACIKRSRLNKKSGAPDPLIQGILFPYFVDDDYGSFGVARAMQWSDKFCEFYTRKGEKIPKMIGPKGSQVKASSHLYILPSEQQKLTHPSVDIAIIEGQAKTLKLIQDLETAGLSEQIAVIGLQGVDQFLMTPEAQQILFRNRGVFLFFDADSQTKPSVAIAEIKAATFCHARGSKFVKAAVWKTDRGNGYDDHSVYAEQQGFPPAVNLPNLIKRSKDVFEVFAPSDTSPGLQIETVCRAVAKVPQLLKHQRTILLNRITKLYKSAGLKSKDVKEVFDQQQALCKQEQQAQKVQENGDLLKNLFDIPYVPDMPETFYISDGYLNHGENPLCRVFVIKKYIATADPESDDFYLLSFRGRDVLIPSRQFSNYRKIAEIFNRNQEILCDSSARYVQEYISKYWHKNRYKPIPIVPMYENTGWDSAGEFRIPTRDNDGEYTHQIKQAFRCEGDPDRQREFVRQVMTDHEAALILLLGFVTPLIGLFNLKPSIVMVYGNPGDGKSTAAFAALSLYGQWEHMYQTMNATKVGKEVACSMAKDLPVLFDELNTAGNGDGKVLAQQLVDTVYGFYSGKGRSRSNISITLQKQKEYQGLLMMTSERSLETIFSVMQHMNIGGAYRRTLEIPVLTKHSLWNYAEADRERFFGWVYDNISRDYGFVGAQWIDYISDQEVQRNIRADYKRSLSNYGDIGMELKGTDHLIALLDSVCPHVARFLELPETSIWTRIQDYLDLIITQQQQQIDRQVKSGVHRFVDALNAFISTYPNAFDGICPPDLPMNKIYGRVTDAKADDDGQQKRHVFLRPEGLKDVCNAYGMDRNGVLVQLREAGIFQPWPVTTKAGQVEFRDYKSMRIRKTGGDVYRFVIDAPPDRDAEEYTDVF